MTSQSIFPLKDLYPTALILMKLWSGYELGVEMGHKALEELQHAPPVQMQVVQDAKHLKDVVQAEQDRTHPGKDGEHHAPKDKNAPETPGEKLEELIDKLIELKSGKIKEEAHEPGWQEGLDELHAAKAELGSLLERHQGQRDNQAKMQTDYARDLQQTYTPGSDECKQKMADFEKACQETDKDLDKKQNREIQQLAEKWHLKENELEKRPLILIDDPNQDRSRP